MIPPVRENHCHILTDFFTFFPNGNIVFFMKVRTSADIGKAVRARRKAIKMTQADAAGLSGVGIRFLSELENGKPTLEIDKVLKVASVMGFDILMEER